MTVMIDLRGVKEAARYFSEFPKNARDASRIAVNEGAKFGARRGSEAIRRQIAFSRNYIGDASNPDARLRIAKFARADDMESVIVARDRPTSLARFASGTPTFGKRSRGPRVRVKAGGASRVLRKGFFIKLRGSEDAYNIGLAVRLKKGERIRNKRKMISLGRGVVLLYGPSVAQTFNTVREDISDDVGLRVQSEFFRQFERLTK